MASKEELVEAVKREINAWGWVKATRYNTGYAGQYMANTESVTETAFTEAVEEIKRWANASEKRAEIRTAHSLSGGDNNERSILVEFWGQNNPSFNFHIRVV